MQDAAQHVAPGVEGWLTGAQADRLAAIAAAVRPGGRIVEIGSFRGRSTIVLASAADRTVDVIAIDPHLGTDRGPQELETSADTGEADNEAFWQNLGRAGLRHRVRLVRQQSADALGEVPPPVDFLYIDGAHRYRPARDDIRHFGALVAAGGTMAVHDAFCSIGVTLAQLRLLAFSAEWRLVGRERSLAVYRHTALDRGERILDALAHVRHLGWFLRNVAIKVAVVAHRPRVAHRFGLPADQAWPY